jgi:hypothetical protein
MKGTLVLDALIMKIKCARRTHRKQWIPVLSFFSESLGVSGGLPKGGKMKKNFVLIIAAIFLLFLTSAAEGPRLLKIEIPAEKNKLLFHLEDLQAIINEFNVEDEMAAIKFTDLSGIELIELGKIKKGKIKWSHKTEGDKYLEVKLKKNIYSMIAPKVQAKSTNPGFQVQVIGMEFDLESTRGKIAQTFEKRDSYVEKADSIKFCDITFGETADLTGDLEYPIEVSPGDDLGGRVKITIRNNGTGPVGEFNVELVLSSDTQVPAKPGTFSDTFAEDMLLQGGRQKIEALKPGESIVLNPEGPLKIPADTPPGRFYLGVVIDTENKIEENSEENNIVTKFIMISYPAPKLITVEMPDMELVYIPQTFAVTVNCRGTVFSDGRDWRKCQIRSYIHQLKQVGWEEKYHWEVNTLNRAMWKITQAVFCKTGGVGEECKAKVEVTGGSKVTPPSKVVFKLADAQLKYEPETGKLQLLTCGDQIAYIPFWKVARLQAHIYQFKYDTWKDFFWEIDTFKKEVRKITGGIFGKEGGTAEPLPFNIIVE